MGSIPETKLGQLYKKHIELILKKDIEGILDQYTHDALLISSFEKRPLYFRGRKELREHFKGILDFKSMEVNITFWGETENCLMITEQIKITTEQGSSQMRFADSWVLHEGKIAIHFAGMVQYSDGSLA